MPESLTVQAMNTESVTTQLMNTESVTLQLMNAAPISAVNGSSPGTETPQTVMEDVSTSLLSTGSKVNLDTPLFEGGLTIGELLGRLETGQISEKEEERAQRVFKRYVEAGAADVDRAHLLGMLRDLGYALTSEEDVERIALGISKMATFDNFEFGQLVERCAAQESRVVAAAVAAKIGREDGATTVPSADLVDVLSFLDVVALQASVDHALEVVDLKGVEHLSHDAVLRFLAAFLAVEGLSRQELAQATKAFSKRAGPDMPLPPRCLIDTLVICVGHRCVHAHKELLQGLGIAGFGKKTGTADERAAAACRCLGGFLVLCRRLRNSELSLVRERFEEADSQGDNRLMAEEVVEVVKQCGYTLFTASQDELFDGLGINRADGLDFEETVHFLERCEAVQGFCRKDYNELVSAFSRFDPDCTGELSVMQMLKLLEFFGYHDSTDVLTALSKEMDFNNNGTMDIGEYLFLMRTHYENTLIAVLESFDRYKSTRTWKLSSNQLQDAIRHLGLDFRHSEHARGIFLSRAVLGIDKDEPFSFPEFVSAVDDTRRVNASLKHKRADFSDEEFSVVKTVFEAHAGSRGELSKGELLWMLAEYDLPVNTVEGREEVLEMMAKAESVARHSGVLPEHLGKAGNTTLPHVLHLLRLFASKHEDERTELEEAAARISGFSPSEVISFRAIFAEAQLFAIQVLGGPIAPAATMPAGSSRRAFTPPPKRGNDETDKPAPSTGLNKFRKAMGGVVAARRANAAKNLVIPSSEEPRTSSRPPSAAPSPGPGGDPQPPAISPLSVVGLDRNRTHVSFAGVRQLLRKLGQQPSQAQVAALNAKVAGLVDPEDQLLSFAGFLWLMRWVLDSNFSGARGEEAEGAEADAPPAAGNIKRRGLAPAATSAEVPAQSLHRRRSV